MPANNGQHSLSTGRDGKFQLQMLGKVYDLYNATNFDQKQETADIKVDPIRGQQLFATLPKGWTGGFEVYRKDAELDRLFSDMERAYNATGQIEYGTLYGYIDEAGGGETVYKFTGVALKLDDAGTFKGDSEVRQKVSFMASTREVK